MKLLRKERRGSRLLRHYDGPQTPLERVRACADVDAAKVAALERLFRRTDPFILAPRIGQHLERLATLRSRAAQPASQLGIRWRGWTFSPRASQAQARSHKNSTPTVGTGTTIGVRGESAVGGNVGAPPVPQPGKNFR